MTLGRTLDICGLIAYIEPVFTVYTTAILPIQLGDCTFVFENLISLLRSYKFTTGTGIALWYVQILTQGGLSVISSYSVFSPTERRLCRITTSIRYNGVYTVDFVAILTDVNSNWYTNSLHILAQPT